VATVLAMQASLLGVEEVEVVGASVVTATATGKFGEVVSSSGIKNGNDNTAEGVGDGVGSSCSITSSSSKSGGKKIDMVGEGEGGQEGDGVGGTLVGSSESVSILEGSSVTGEEVGTPLLIT